jgi:hypothetical protein
MGFGKSPIVQANFVAMGSILASFFPIRLAV